MIGLITMAVVGGLVAARLASLPGGSMRLAGVSPACAVFGKRWPA